MVRADSNKCCRRSITILIPTTVKINVPSKLAGSGTLVGSASARLILAIELSVEVALLLAIALLITRFQPIASNARLSFSLIDNSSPGEIVGSRIPSPKLSCQCPF